MDEFDLGVLAKYPFLSEAKEYVASLNLTLVQISDHPVYSSAVELGRVRVSGALSGDIKTDLSGKIPQELTLLSYVIARILVNATKNPNIISRYAKSEAHNAYVFLRKESATVLDKVSKDLGVGFNVGRMDFTQYLALTRDLASDSKWKLVNRVMENGEVLIKNKTEALELLREAVKGRIMAPIDTRNIPESFKVIAEQFKNEYTDSTVEIQFKELNLDAVPPCITKILSSLKSGSASHLHMFILGTFFMGVGLDIEGVLKVFSVSPKFDAEKTRYQLGFLSGEKGATQYKCPACVKIKSYGFCVSDCGIKHPLQYYKYHKNDARNIKNKKTK